MNIPIEFSIPLPYGLLYVSDAGSDDNPDVDGKGLYWRTGSMLAIACQGDQDGPTKILIGGEDAGEDLTLVTALDLAAPSRRLLFETVPHEAFHEMTLDGTVAHVELWTKGYQGTPVVWLKVG